MEKKRIYISPPHMGGDELKLIHEAFHSNWIAPVGPHIDQFEQEICRTVGIKYAVALSSGTAALHLAMLLLDVNRGDEVICSTFTFAASANVVVYRGALPVFIDSEAETWGMDPKLLDVAIQDRIRKGKKPKAVILVHLYGQPAAIGPILEICNHHNVALVEDAAESLGSLYEGKHTGVFGRCGVFSFNGNKIITTSGGGMLVSNDKELIDKARFFATQARDPAPHYEHSYIGYNYRLSNICAAIGLGQLRVLDERVQKKRNIFEYYKKKLGSIPGVSFMPEQKCCRSNRWLTCMCLDPNSTVVKVEDIRHTLDGYNIESRPFWKPMHLQPVFKNCPVYTNGIAERLFTNGLCLPSGTALTEEDQEMITGHIMRCLGR